MRKGREIIHVLLCEHMSILLLHRWKRRQQRKCGRTTWSLCAQNLWNLMSIEAERHEKSNCIVLDLNGIRVMRNTNNSIYR